MPLKPGLARRGQSPLGSLPGAPGPVSPQRACEPPSVKVSGAGRGQGQRQDGEEREMETKGHQLNLFKKRASARLRPRPWELRGWSEAGVPRPHPMEPHTWPSWGPAARPSCSILPPGRGAAESEPHHHPVPKGLGWHLAGTIGGVHGSGHLLGHTPWAGGLSPVAGPALGGFSARGRLCCPVRPPKQTNPS